MSNSTAKSWRDVLPIHPAAELFPMMSEGELRELGEDIKKNGLRQPIIYCDDEKGRCALLDGRNRVAAMELVGIATVSDKGIVVDANGALFNGTELAYTTYRGAFDDPYGTVLSLNIHRRHLTAKQKRELIAKLLKTKPATSNRQIAKQVKADDKTVAKVRTELESTAEIPQLRATVGGDGKTRKATKPKVKKPRPLPDTPIALGVRLCQEFANHVSKTDPVEFARALRMHLTDWQAGELFTFLAKVKDSFTARDASPPPLPNLNPDDLSIPPFLKRGTA